MINKEQRIIELTSLGLSVNEAKTYLALLVKNSMTVNEIAQISGVPRAKLYGVITKLIIKGFCLEKVGDIKRYRAVNPNVVVDKLNENYQQQIEQRKKIAKNFSDSIISFYQQNMNKTDPLEYIEVLKDKEQIGERWLTSQKNARNEILVFVKQPYAIPHTENLNEEIDVLKKRIKIKGIYEYKDVIREEFVKVVSLCISAGEEARIVKELPMKMAIFDQKIVMLTLENRISSKQSLTTMTIEHPDLAKTLSETFNMYWQKSMTFEEFKIKSK